MGRKQKPQENRPGSPAWMTTWADLVCLLMCFFVLLFSLSNVDEARFQEFAQAMAGRRIFLQGALGTIFNESAGLMPENSPPTPPRQNPLDPPADDEYDPITEAVRDRQAQMAELAETFRTYMAPYDEDVMAEIGITVNELGEYVRFTFPSGMLFNSGQAFLTPDAVEMIDYVAGFLARYPGHRIAVHGHTDNIPINTLQFPSNWQLSASRAIAVVDRLVSYHGFDPWMLDAVGMGEYRPIDSNDTAEGRANNRRVEVLVFAQQQNLTVLEE